MLLKITSKTTQQQIVLFFHKVLCNNDFSAYIASGFDPSKIKNISDDLKGELIYIGMGMIDIIDNIESIDSKLLKTAVNMEALNLIHFDGEWKDKKKIDNADPLNPNNSSKDQLL